MNFQQAQNQFQQEHTNPQVLSPKNIYYPQMPMYFPFPLQQNDPKQMENKMQFIYLAHQLFIQPNQKTE